MNTYIPENQIYVHWISFIHIYLFTYIYVCFASTLSLSDIIPESKLRARNSSSSSEKEEFPFNESDDNESGGGGSNVGSYSMDTIYMDEVKILQEMFPDTAAIEVSECVCLCLHAFVVFAIALQRFPKTKFEVVSVSICVFHWVMPEKYVSSQLLLVTFWFLYYRNLYDSVPIIFSQVCNLIEGKSVQQIEHCLVLVQHLKAFQSVVRENSAALTWHNDY